MSSKRITTSKRLAHNTIFNIITLFSSAAISFFLIRFFLGQLGETRYGVWVLIGSIFRYRDLMGMGLNSAINRYIPVYLAKNNNDGIRRVISTSFFFFSTLAIVLAVASVVIYYNIGSWFTIRADLIATAGTLVLIIGFCACFAMPIQLASAALSGLQRYDILNLAVLVPMVLRTVLLVVLLTRGYGLITMGLAFGFSEIAMRVLQFAFVRKLLPEISISFKSIDLKLFREMLAYGINTFLYAMGAVIIYKASDLVIGIFLGTAEISQFAVATAAVLLLSQFLQAFTRAIKPAVSDLDARDKHSQVREISFLMQKYSLLLIIPSGCFLIAMGREFLWVWVGEKFQDASSVEVMSVILSILTVGHCLRLAQHSNFVVLVGKGEHKVFGILTAVIAILCIVLSVVSIKVLKMGLIGIAWSNFLPMAIISGLVLPIYFNWKMQITIKESIKQVWLPALLGTLPVVAMISTWRYLARPDSWPEIASVVVAAIALTLISSWFLSFSELERKRFLKILVSSWLRN
jgi:O-antigen/teichoic acid export membrane protein